MFLGFPTATLDTYIHGSEHHQRYFNHRQGGGALFRLYNAQHRSSKVKRLNIVLKKLLQN